MALGEKEEAQETINLLSQSDLLQRGIEDDRTRSLRARVCLLSGQMEAAVQWADLFTPPQAAYPLMWIEEPALTKARILLARGGPSDTDHSLHLLDQLYELASRNHSIVFQIEIHALRALALSAKPGHRIEEAMVILQQAVSLAQPGGLVRVFLDLGAPMQRLLRQLVSQGYDTAFVHRIMDAFNGAAYARLHPEYLGANHENQVEHLTSREIDILVGMRQRLSDKEIAARLVVSVPTVKRHATNIYAKLGVNRRWDAVVKAEALGLLPPG